MGGFSQSRLGRVADLLAGSVQRGEAAEVVALLSRGGETHAETAGGAEPDTIFRIASMSKPVAAVAALILVEECETVPAERPITLRDLLTFQLGIGFGQGMFGPPGAVPIMDALDALRGGMPRPAEVVEPDEWMRQLGALPLVAQPGTRWLPSGAGGLVSTAPDYFAFASMLMGGGSHRGARILSRPSVTLMTSDQLPASVKAVSGLAPGDFDAMGWGFGVSVVTRRTQVYHSAGTYGWNGGLGTTWANDPAENLTLILLTQHAFTSHLGPVLLGDFSTTAYQALED